MAPRRGAAGKGRGRNTGSGLRQLLVSPLRRAFSKARESLTMPTESLVMRRKARNGNSAVPSDRTDTQRYVGAAALSNTSRLSLRARAWEGGAAGQPGEAGEGGGPASTLPRGGERPLV